MVYCAAGMREPLEAIARDYTAAYGVPVEFKFAGSGALLADMRAAQAGDLFVAADQHYIDQARRLGLVDDSIPLATQHVVATVAKGNPRNVRTLADLARDDVRLSLPNPEVAAVGKLAREALAAATVQNRPAWDALAARQMVARDTVNAVANDVKTAAADAGLVWDSTVSQYAELEVVSLPELEAAASHIAVGVLGTAVDSRRAWHFARFVAARETGQPHWRRLGHVPAAADAWAEVPEITFFCGGVLRPAVEAAVAEFELREGAQVNVSYNGCGVLLGQIKGGGVPDVYFACDTTFMTPAVDLFPHPQDVTATDMVLIVPRGNPDGVRTLADLARPGLKVGVCHPQQSALGQLTENLLRDRGLLDAVTPNVRDTPATADRLVEHVLIGSLQAAIVYRANTVRQADKLEVLPLDGTSAAGAPTRAVQPIAVAAGSAHKQLAYRLVRHLRAAARQTHFERFGFQWRGEALAP